eukprot:NODE_2083_length_657_cov_61.833962_g2033_i0.p1 GENE.NODE_2083_length_657_cov_61.833962_g2033_i0~~NODE_2083_length_657_cov_61.833962_g2033_i0.p1  ORF type:complete len:100 (-),score=8.74 NODE_2083_length_657_cov_61.833962_g2033_i0:274-573(-)
MADLVKALFYFCKFLCEEAERRGYAIEFLDSFAATSTRTLKTSPSCANSTSTVSLFFSAMEVAWFLYYGYKGAKWICETTGWRRPSECSILEPARCVEI